jgi:hypothetical protein
MRRRLGAPLPLLLSLATGASRFLERAEDIGG